MVFIFDLSIFLPPRNIMLTGDVNKKDRYQQNRFIY